ncbi:MAG: hypothetical protein FWJ85_07500 [Solitalea sp.]
MFATVFFLVLLGFYTQYNLSKKARLADKPAGLLYLAKHVRLSRLVGLSSAVIAFVLLIQRLGPGAGLFGFGALLMCAGCLVVTLAPYGYLKPGWLVASYLGTILLEILFFG